MVFTSSHQEACAIRTKSLPKFSPRKRPMKARGAVDKRARQLAERNAARRKS
jgi:hypothetical protein